MGSRGAVNFELSLRARGAAITQQLGRAAVQPRHRAGPRHRHAGGRARRITVPGLRPPPIPLAVAGALAELDVGGGADDPAIDAHWGEPGLSASEKVFGWNSLDVLTFGAGDPAKPVNAIPPEASAWCQLRFVVGTDWRALETHVREHLRQAGFGQVRIRLGAQAGATRLSPDNAWVRWAAASIERSTGKRPALLPNLGGSLPTTSSPTCWACPRSGCPTRTRPARSTRPTSTCWAASPARAWPSWPACSGTWATRTGPARRRRAPSTLTPRPRHVHQDPRRRNRPGPGRRRWRRDAHAAYPEQPIKIVVPFTPGGATDSVARLLASKLAGKLGQPVIIENRPGASTVIGAEAVARARPDGYTLMVSGSTTYSVLPALKTDLPYDPLRSYEHIAIVSLAPLVLLARKDLPASTAGEAAELARKQSGKGELMYGTFGPGSAPHLAGEMYAGPPAPE